MRKAVLFLQAVEAFHNVKTRSSPEDFTSKPSDSPSQSIEPSSKNTDLSSKALELPSKRPSVRTCSRKVLIHLRVAKLLLSEEEYEDWRKRTFSLKTAEDNVRVHQTLDGGFTMDFSLDIVEDVPAIVEEMMRLGVSQASDEIVV